MKRLSALVPGMLRSATLEKKPDRIEVDIDLKAKCVS
jgi:hypothetical protein